MVIIRRTLTDGVVNHLRGVVNDHHVSRGGVCTAVCVAHGDGIGRVLQRNIVKVRFGASGVPQVRQRGIVNILPWRKAADGAHPKVTLIFRRFSGRSSDICIGIGKICIIKKVHTPSRFAIGFSTAPVCSIVAIGIIEIIRTIQRSSPNQYQCSLNQR